MDDSIDSEKGGEGRAADEAPACIFGCRFSDPALLDEALTTPSFRMSTPDSADNQRLEFLGDAVLGVLAADALFNAMPRASEGELTVRRTHMVSTAALCAAAARFGLAARLKRNKGADALAPNSKTLADAVEAIFGAAYLDGGLEAARRVFKALALADNAESGSWSENPKGELQLIAQAMTPRRLPSYETLSVGGKSHEPVFTVRVSVPGMGEATGVARSRKEAEAIAAARLIEADVARHEALAAARQGAGAARSGAGRTAGLPGRGARPGQKRI